MFAFRARLSRGSGVDVKGRKAAGETGHDRAAAPRRRRPRPRRGHAVARVRAEPRARFRRDQSVLLRPPAADDLRSRTENRADARCRAPLSPHARDARLRPPERRRLHADAAHPGSRVQLSLHRRCRRRRAEADGGAREEPARDLLPRGARRRRHRLRRPRAGKPHHDHQPRRRVAAAGARPRWARCCWRI